MSLGPGSPDGALRVMTYNVHRWGDDREAVARVIRTCAPDLAMIQEAPTWWGTYRRRLRFADSVGLHHLAGEARTVAFVADPARWTFRSQRIWRPVLRRRRSYVVPQLPGGAVAVSTTVAGRPLSVIGCHLGLSIPGRVTELRQVLGMADRLQPPYLVVGDVNEDTGGPIWQLAEQSGLIDQHADPARARPTYPAAGPHRRIDVVWSSPGIRVDPVDLDRLGLDRGLLVRASDHFPLVVDVQIEP